MHRLFLTCLVGAACVAIVQTPAPASAAEDAMAACRAASGRYVEAIATGDPETVAAQFTAAGLVTAPEGIFPGREAIVGLDRGYVVPGVRQTVSPTQAQAVGGGILCAGTYRVMFAPGFPMKQVGGNYTALLVRDGGDWQHAMLTYNYTPPPMPSQGQ